MSTTAALSSRAQSRDSHAKTAIEAVPRQAWDDGGPRMSTTAVDVPAPASAPAPASSERAHRVFATASRWRWEEIVFWVAAAISIVVFPTHLVLIAQVLITGLFALSFDLLVGYAGIPSLGHAAFFGIGAYTAGLLAHAGWTEPISGLVPRSNRRRSRGACAERRRFAFDRHRADHDHACRGLATV